MKNNKIELPMKDISSNSANRDELIQIGGKPQVPCLVIDGRALYESVDIIKWLEKNYKK
jgi:glutathione S-transferase